MRQAGKRQAVELLRAMSNAHVEIKKNFERQMQQPVLDALTRCQETAIELGNLIESSEGEGFITVSYLEEYCELVFQIYDKLSKFNDAHGDNVQIGGTMACRSKKCEPAMKHLPISIPTEYIKI